MKGKIKDIVLMGVVMLFCFLPVFSICPFNLPGANVARYFRLWLKLLAYFAASGIVGYILRNATDRKLRVGYIAVTVLCILAYVMIGMLPVERFPFVSYLDTYGSEECAIFFVSLLVMLGYAGIDKWVKHLSGREWNFNLTRCFLVMAGVPIIVWHIEYWVNGIGIKNFWAIDFLVLYVARVFGVLISGLVAGRMLGCLNCRTIH